MVSHDNFLRDPHTTFDISSNSSSPLVSPSYSTDSTQSEGESSASSSAFTFSAIQRATSPSLTLSTNSTFTALRANAEQDLLEEEEEEEEETVRNVLIIYIVIFVYNVASRFQLLCIVYIYLRFMNILYCILN